MTFIEIEIFGSDFSQEIDDKGTLWLEGAGVILQPVVTHLRADEAFIVVNLSTQLKVIFHAGHTMVFKGNSRVTVRADNPRDVTVAA